MNVNAKVSLVVSYYESVLGPDWMQGKSDNLILHMINQMLPAITRIGRGSTGL